MFHVEQNITNEIVHLLMKGDLHPRGLAEKLHSNHMTVSRRLRNLIEENVVDYRKEGKNKVYFLKKSIEGRNAVMIAEIYRQSNILHQYPVLRGIFESFQEIPGIPLVLLFGSYAKGRATKESDIDVYAETLDTDVKKQLERRHSSLSIKIGTFDPSSPLIREIIKDHIVIRGVEVYFEKIEFFTKTA